MIQVFALAALGVAIGLIAGATLPLLGARFLVGILPVPPVLGVYPTPLLAGGRFTDC